MKHIAVFCDGTWNSSDAPHPTNVVQLAQAVMPVTPSGVVQQIVYLPGVGVGRGSTGVARWLDRIAGGVLGLGLNLTLEDAYRTLIFSHEPGDRIFLFGYSRGAYMARSLAGLLRASGLPERSQVGAAGRALARYRSPARSTRPDEIASFAFRLAHGPGVTTSEAERAWRNDQGHPPGVPLGLAYLGVWDTVGAMGVPAHYALLAGLLNGPHRFHDCKLSRMVERARHAVALDERRQSFAPALWDNLDQLNADQPDRYRQVWFPGNHGSVGGGGDRRMLSDRALHWIAAGAQEAGLVLDTGRLPPDRGVPCPETPLRNRSHAPGWAERLMALTGKDRAGPARLDDVAPEARDRWQRNPAYRPRSLDHVSRLL
ncbi:MAG: phospholipase effector Tle1 domain-containing protein [Alkalilacustris sp.]